MSLGARLAVLVTAVLGASGLYARDVSAQTQPSSCVTCHASLPQASLADPAKHTSGDVHDKVNVSCSECHGGNARAAAQAGAHDPGHGYKNRPSAAICANCHVLFAEKFATSPHAPVFERGCVECHGNHGVEKVSDAMVGTSQGALCLTCHSEKDDPGFIGAERMGRRILTLSRELDAGTTQIHGIRNAGMEVGDQELALAEARTKLILARTELHAFNPASLDVIVEDGLKLVSAANDGGQRALQELAYRRRGLYLSFGAILLMITGLALKIRHLAYQR